MALQCQGPGRIAMQRQNAFARQVDQLARVGGRGVPEEEDRDGGKQGKKRQLRHA